MGKESFFGSAQTATLQQKWCSTGVSKGNYPLIARVARFTSTLETVYDKNMGGSKKTNPLRPSYEEGDLRDKSIKRKQRAGFQPKDLLRIIRKATEKAPDGA